MTKTAKEMALKILNSDMVGTMATVQENKPHSRYMTFFNEDFVLYTFTGRNTHKVDELKINPYTQYDRQTIYHALPLFHRLVLISQYS